MDSDITTIEWMDIDIIELPNGDGDLVAAPGHSHVYKYKERFAVKIGGQEKELEMMQNAGTCSITPRGRVLQSGEQVGIIMDLGQAVDVMSLDVVAKKKLMRELISLVTALHDKGLIHGDIKLANLLIAPNGSLRLCDFEGCQHESLAEAPEESTLNWMSPIRLRNLNLPISKADDFYALGLTIWEIFAGKIPFSGLDESEVEKRIEVGETVDLSEIAELDVRGIIEEYLKLGSSI